MSQLLASPFRNLVAGVVVLLMISAGATAAYVALGWDPGNALYMVVITVFTVGYAEVEPVNTPELRAVTMALIVAGCTNLVFMTGSLVQLVTATQLRRYFGAIRMEKDIGRLSGHVIICGYGRIGQMLAHELQAARAEFLILEREDERIEAARAAHYCCVKGDARDEDVLKHAGISRARAVATVLPDDAANVFITLSARALNPALTIIARGEVPSTENKLLQAGADRVVLPARIGAERMAELLLYKDVTQMIAGTKPGSLAQLGADLQRLGLSIEIVTAEAKSRAVGATIGEVEALGAGTFLVVALERHDGETILQPHNETVIRDGDGVALVARPGCAGAVELVFAAPTPTGEAAM